MEKKEKERKRREKKRETEEENERGKQVLKPDLDLYRSLEY